MVNCNTGSQSRSDLEEAAARKRHRRTNERKKGILFHLEKNILYLLHAGRKDLKWSLIPGSNSGRREPSFSRGFKLQCCSGFKPLAYEDPNMVTKCLGTKHTRHISRRINFVKNGEKCKMHKIDGCEGGLQLADIGTKNVSEPDLTPRMKYIMVRLEN